MLWDTAPARRPHPDSGSTKNTVQVEATLNTDKNLHGPMSHISSLRYTTERSISHAPAVVTNTVQKR